MRWRRKRRCVWPWCRPERCPFDTEACVDKAVRLIGEAAASGAKVIVFPEAFVPGLPQGAQLRPRRRRARSGGTRGVPPLPRRRDRGARPADAAPGRSGRRARRVRGHRRDRARGRHLLLHGAVLRPGRALLGKHRKLMPTAMERVIWGFGDGSTLTVVDSPYGRIGSVICWENYMPMLRMAMYAKNVALYCAPTADDRDTWLPSMQHVALEGRCFVLTACQFIRKKDFPDYRARVARRFAGRGADARRQRHRQSARQGAGRARISSGETILTADLDLERHRPRQVRLRRRRPLQPAGCLPADRQRGADAGGGDQGSGLTRRGQHAAARPSANDRPAPGSSRASGPSAFRCLAATRRAPCGHATP